MKRYYNKEETPLAFHKFFWYVSLPLSFVIFIAQTIFMLLKLNYVNWSGPANIVYYLIALALILMCFIGFFKWKAYAWYGLMAYFSVLIFWNVFWIVYYALTSPFLIASISIMAGELAGSLIYVILVGIYYIKRRPLFFPKPQTEGAAVMAKASIMVDTAATDSTQNKGFCHECGTPLSRDGKFCGNCGTPVVR